MFWNKILGLRDFSKQEQIEEMIGASYEHLEASAFAQIATLIFFKTKRQQTWLAATSNALYCVLDDVESDRLKIRWKMERFELIEHNEFILDIQIIQSYKENSGLIHFGDKHRNWLYSKSLYPTPKLLMESIEALVLSQMKTNDWPN